MRKDPRLGHRSRAAPLRARDSGAVRLGRESRTAEYVALFRALETVRPSGERLFSDPLAAAFLTPRLRVGVALAALPGIGRLVPALVDRRWPGPRASAVARTREIGRAHV